METALGAWLGTRALPHFSPQSTVCALVNSAHLVTGQQGGVTRAALFLSLPQTTTLYDAASPPRFPPRFSCTFLAGFRFDGNYCFFFCYNIHRVRNIGRIPGIHLRDLVHDPFPVEGFESGVFETEIRHVTTNKKDDTRCVSFNSLLATMTEADTRACSSGDRLL